MANLYTKTGDKGTTSLFGGERIPKNSIKVECYGIMDEANSMLGLAYSQSKNENVRKHINQIQQRIFSLGAELASDEKGKQMLQGKINSDDVSYLERVADECTAIVGKQTNFVVPGVNQVSASLHVARTIVRRAERSIVTLNEFEPVRQELMRYVNRLSDAIFALARVEESAAENGANNDIILKSDKKAKKEELTAAEKQQVEALKKLVIVKVKEKLAKIMTEQAAAPAEQVPAKEELTVAEKQQVEALKQVVLAKVKEKLAKIMVEEPKSEAVKEAQPEVEVSEKPVSMEENESINLDLKTAKKLAEFAEEKAKEINVPMVISVVDAGGNIMLMERMEDSLLASIDISLNKAYTAVSLKMPTETVAELCRPGDPLYGIQNTNNNRIVTFGGGIPFMYKGKVVGALGISGGSVEEDLCVAKYAMESILKTTTD